MVSRLHLVLGVLVACALAAVVAVGLAARSGGSVSAAVYSADEWAGAIRPAAAPPARIRLRDQDGRLVDIASTRGRPAVVTFMYSTCQDTCPAQAQTIRGAMDELGRDVPVLAVSVDPATDTRRLARAFVGKQHMLGRMSFLLGDRSSLAPVWDAFGVRPQDGDLEHSASIVLLDRAGKQAIGFPANEATVEALVHDLRRLDAGDSPVSRSPAA